MRSKLLMSLWLRCAVASILAVCATRAVLTFTLGSYYDYRYALTATPGVPALSQPQGLAVNYSTSRMFAADTGRHVIREVIPRRSVTVFGGRLDVAGAIDGPAAEALFNHPTGLALDNRDDTLYVADTGNHTIRKIAAGIVSTVAGLPGAAGSADGAGSAARFNAPRGVYFESFTGDLYVADTGNHTIRRVSASGTVTTIAGMAGVPGSADGQGAAARFNSPWGISQGYVTDSGNHTIRLVQLDGTVSTYAGLAGVSGSSDGSTASARFNRPTGITCCAEGAAYIADTGNHLIRELAFGTVYTNGGSPGVSGFVDGGPSDARFREPSAIALNNAWDIFIADTGNAAIVHGARGTSLPRRAPTFLAHPSSRAVNFGASADFTCAATGSAETTAEWETSTDGGQTWTLIHDDASFRGTRTSTLTVRSASFSLHGTQYRCIMSNLTGVATSAAATLTVNGFPATSASLRFGAVRAVAGGALLSVTPAQAVSLRWPAGTSPHWTVSADQPWLRVDGGSGTGNGSFTVSITEAAVNVAIGTTATAVLSIATDNASLSFAWPVTLTVHSSTASSPPVGVFETPANNATGQQGAIAVTGWALDDVAVDHVEIWRDRVPGETTPVFTGAGPGNGRIFIANALFVPGARPDVERAFATTPMADRAGWGYLLLTQGLWNRGNGTYTLHAFAFDVEGKTATLGSRTITVDNANATRPFGTIDTPSYGGTVSGVIQNFGWALTPGTTCTIMNPNVQVSIDSGPLTPVTYGDARSDIASAFAGHTNATAAGGHYTLDTTALADGMHTIGWLVTDSCGRADGMGSRFFTVANGSNASTASPVSRAHRWTAAAARWIVARAGGRTETAAQAADGTRIVRVDQDERIEIQVPDGFESARQLVAGASRGLPIGSSFDPTEGKFYWQPADRSGIDTLHVWAYAVGGGVPRFVGVADAGGRRPDVAALYGASFADAGFSVTGSLPRGTYDLIVYAHSAATNTFAGAEVVRVTVR